MRLRVIWPGKTHGRAIEELVKEYLDKINHMESCELIVSKEAKGIPEKNAQRIKSIEADGIEKHLSNDFRICLDDKGKEMNSSEFARVLENVGMSSARAVTFIVGGYLGLEERLLDRADMRLSLSKMTYSHELSRVLLCEQIYRALTILQGKSYAK